MSRISFEWCSSTCGFCTGPLASRHLLSHREVLRFTINGYGHNVSHHNPRTGGILMPSGTNDSKLDPTVLELANEPNYAAFTTLLPSGHPQTQMMWVDTDGQHIRINTEVHRQKFKNVERDPRVTVMIRDENNPFRYAE